MSKILENVTNIVKVKDNMDKYPWSRWLKDKLTGKVQWFVIVWRLPWFALIYIGLYVTYIGVIMCYGIRRANEFWISVT